MKPKEPRYNRGGAFDPIPASENPRSQRLDCRVTREEKRAAMRVALDESKLRGKSLTLAEMTREILLADPRIQKYLT